MATNIAAATTALCCAGVTPSRKPFEINSAFFNPLPTPPSVITLTDVVVEGRTDVVDD